MLNLTEIQFEEVRWAPILKFLPTIWFLQMRWAPLQTIANTNTDICRKIAWRYIIRNCPMFLHSGLLHNAPHSECNTKFIIRSCSLGVLQIIFAFRDLLLRSLIIALKMVHISDLGVQPGPPHETVQIFISLRRLNLITICVNISYCRLVLSYQPSLSPLSIFLQPWGDRIKNIYCTIFNSFAIVA